MQKDTTILIVEDSPEDYEACADALSADTNFANPLVWCETGNLALDYLHKRGQFAGADHNLPGIILLDLNMPGLDGRDVLAKLKQDPLTKCIPVIVMTSSSDPVDIERCYEIGANSYVVKPVELEGFISSIARLKDYWFEVVVLPHGAKKHRPPS